jgi:hypothetical protein
MLSFISEPLNIYFSCDFMFLDMPFVVILKLLKSLVIIINNYYLRALLIVLSVKISIRFYPNCWNTSLVLLSSYLKSLVKIY